MSDISQVNIIEYSNKYKKGAVGIYVNVLGNNKNDAEKDIKHHLKNEVSKIFIAVEDRKVLGVTTFFWQKWNQVGKVGIIGDSIDLRSKGAGKKLMQKVFEFARSIKVRKIYVDTSVENKSAQVFYIKVGFYPEHIMKDYYKEEEDGINFAIKL